MVGVCLVIAPDVNLFPLGSHANRGYLVSVVFLFTIHHLVHTVWQLHNEDYMG